MISSIGGRQAALHIGQRHIGDGLIQRLHQRGADGTQRNDRTVRYLIGRGDSGRNLGGLHFGGLRGRHCLIQIAPASDMPGVDIGNHTHTRAQRRVAVVTLDPDADRYSLHHLDPVAGCVLRRQHRKLRAAVG